MMAKLGIKLLNACGKTAYFAQLSYARKQGVDNRIGLARTKLLRRGNKDNTTASTVQKKPV
jgi:hypothetical protein